ncbi:hypothetical protein D3C80_590500 [compost metagenome]
MLRVAFHLKRHRRLAAGHRQIDFRQDLGIEQCAVQRTLAVVYLITTAQGVEVVALAREQATRH